MIGWMREIEWTAICIKNSTVLDRAVTLYWLFCVNDNWKAMHAARERKH